MAAVVAMTLFALWAGNAQFEAAAGDCANAPCTRATSVLQFPRLSAPSAIVR
jgi:hypothetical protein